MQITDQVSSFGSFCI